MQWIAERFFTAGHRWIDAASARAVRVRVCDAHDGDDMEWSDQCATLSNLRHPLLNRLLDYGIGPNGCRFEAYERSEPVQVGTADTFGVRLLDHVTQFLRASHISLPPGRAAVALRPIVAGRPVWRRPLGITLQGRRALGAVEESLDALCPAGPAVINIHGSNNAGLRTFRMIAARAARLKGFVPVSPSTVRQYPALVRTLRERHVCVLDDLEEKGRSAAGVACLISTLASSSARRHVIFRFRRDIPKGGIRLDELSVRSLVRMVFVEADDHPPAEELNAAARAADGLPGLFVARLCGSCTVASRAMMIHETPATYAPEAAPELEPAVITGRVLGAALRARDRASALAARGRHSVAVRLLHRGIRVLEGRERTRDAAQCALQLGWLLLDRGATAKAWQAFERAQRLAGESSLGVTATIGLGVALVDERRLIEAEAVLRGAIAASETIAQQDITLAAAAALSRCLIWQDRYEEAMALASTFAARVSEPRSAVRLLATSARAQARVGRLAAAVRTARDAQRAATNATPQMQASVELALAEALGAAGDLEGRRAAVSRALRLARTHHLPLVRVRAALINETHTSSPVLHRLKRIKLPPLLAHRLRDATAPSSPRVEAVAELEKLLDLAQRATDDAAAAMQVCRVVGERLGAAAVAIFGNDDRALAVHGRGWPELPMTAKQVLAHGSAVRPDANIEPRESAEPIRYGGEVIAALSCRWIAGVLFDPAAAAVVLRAAALSAAPHVRNLLDRPPMPQATAWADLLGASPAAAALRESVARAARAPFPVLVEGESGSGKELVARALHRFSARRERRFCALNCAALTDDLVESELFGHTRGAFTGAATERAGLFEEADGGTLFLDEIGELSPRAQAKLLRVLQEGEVRRVGENFPRRVDVRVVAATNRKLEEEVSAGRFRADLRFRLDVVRIAVPPLRERATDIPLLASHFWQDASARVGSRATLSPEALAALARYDWPGNVRELQNVIAWIAVQSPRRGRIGPSALPRHVAQATVAAPCSFEAAREEFERRFVRAALAGANGQRARAAEALGITRQGLSKMMKRLQIAG